MLQLCHHFFFPHLPPKKNPWITCYSPAATSTAASEGPQISTWTRAAFSFVDRGVMRLRSTNRRQRWATVKDLPVPGDPCRTVKVCLRAISTAVFCSGFRMWFELSFSTRKSTSDRSTEIKIPKHDVSLLTHQDWFENRKWMCPGMQAEKDSGHDIANEI